ncbi:MAG: IS200/IS605 family transposase [Chitinophagaceae bacterium]|nr:MAG: IS200/IS605 family transposase [Chitinophagaceae bacterium]
MGHTLNKSWIHVVWSTKKRQPFILPEIERYLYSELARLFEDQGCQLLALNGMPDHIHALIGPRLDRAVSDTMHRVKGASAHWMNRQSVPGGPFAWQTGYAVISVSHDIVRRVVGYIEHQKEHHQKIVFAQEWAQYEALGATWP